MTCATASRLAASEDHRTNLVGLSRAALVAEMAAIGEKPFRAKQLWHWIYYRGVTDFGLMSSLAKPLQGRLAECYQVARPSIARQQTSSDGTRKWLLAFSDRNQAETV